MTLPPNLYRLFAKSFKYDSVKWAKDVLRPITHALVGARGIHKALPIVRERAMREGRDVKIAFDVGAAVGDTALLMARAFPRATIFCFEPLPQSFERLRKRTAPLGARARCFPFGFYNKGGEADFHIASEEDSSSLFPLALAGEKYRMLGIKEIGKARVEMRTLDDFAKRIGDPPIDFMKIDVEGAEKEVLEGGRRTIRRCVRDVYVEIEPLRRGARARDHLDVFAYLHDAGFSLLGAMDECNFLFSKL